MRRFLTETTCGDVADGWRTHLARAVYCSSEETENEIRWAHPSGHGIDRRNSRVCAGRSRARSAEVVVDHHRATVTRANTGHADRLCAEVFSAPVRITVYDEIATLRLLACQTPEAHWAMSNGAQLCWRRGSGLRSALTYSCFSRARVHSSKLARET